MYYNYKVYMKEEEEEEKIIKIKLQKLYKKILGKSLNWNKINKEKYYEEFINLVKSNKIFSKLYEKYNLKDISLNKEIIYNKHIYVYIFFEKLYNEIKNSNKLKEKLMNIKFPISTKSPFLIVKRFSLDLFSKFNEFCNNLGLHGKLFKNITFLTAMSINIFEAIITDIFHLEIANSFIGFILILFLPFSNKYINDDKRYISKEWLDLYTSWNYNFIYNNGPGNNYFPVGGICLISSLKHAKNNLWTDNRFYTLYLTTILVSNDILLMDKKINKEFRNDWNKLNLEYIKELL